MSLKTILSLFFATSAVVALPAPTRQPIDIGPVDYATVNKRQDVSVDGIDSVPYFEDFVSYSPGTPVALPSDVTKRQVSASAVQSLHLAPGPVVIDGETEAQLDSDVNKRQVEIDGIDSVPYFEDFVSYSPGTPVALPSDVEKRGLRRRQAPSPTAATTAASGTSSEDGYVYAEGYEPGYGYIEVAYAEEEYDGQEYYVPVAAAEIVPEEVSNSTAADNSTVT